jgi:hypothetical protein
MLLQVDHRISVVRMSMAQRPCQQQGDHEKEQGALKAQGPRGHGAKVRPNRPATGSVPRLARETTDGRDGLFAKFVPSTSPA